MSMEKRIRFILNRKTTARYFWRLRCKALDSKFGFFREYHKYRYMSLLQKFGAFIPLAAEISDCPVLPHGLNGVFISQGAKIGKNATIFHHVTIGSNTLPDSKGFGIPVIKDNVYIGAGAKIIGAVTIGNNVRIGANAVVVNDVPDNSTVVLAESRVIIHKNPPDNSSADYNDAVQSE